MLVHVECKGVLKWVRIPMTDDCYDYFQLIQEGPTHRPIRHNLSFEENEHTPDGHLLHVSKDCLNLVTAASATHSSLSEVANAANRMNKKKRLFNSPLLF
ncbi:hypothetical protein SKAU_G00103900 [Synaphobranchus kaupii]|uniref:Uncharacterized protein n=1 Tax=Synaphobranchus kaupii TaxID=118154 RepID=A0A9Q1FZB2_SYNKA|nr:hypothetical protein SKAU_G00103900 [Synaphobranchus kaupii]